jgi:hypothetical protein
MDLQREYKDFLYELEMIIKDQLEISRNVYVNKVILNLEDVLKNYKDRGLNYNIDNILDVLKRNYTYGITRFLNVIAMKNSEYMLYINRQPDAAFDIMDKHYEDIYLEIRRIDNSTSFGDVVMRTSVDTLEYLKRNDVYDDYQFEIKHDVKKVIGNSFDAQMDNVKEEIISNVTSLFDNFKNNALESQNQALEMSSGATSGKRLVKALPNMISSSEEEVIESLPIDGIFK